MRTIPKSLIRQMPYDERLRRYHLEKNALLAENRAMSAVELNALHRDLAKKWMV